MGLQALAREEERIRESGREREDEAAKIFGERTREEDEVKREKRKSSVVRGIIWRFFFFFFFSF
jgi:hypothetical protein